VFTAQRARFCRAAQEFEPALAHDLYIAHHVNVAYGDEAFSPEKVADLDLAAERLGDGLAPRPAQHFSLLPGETHR